MTDDEVEIVAAELAKAGGVAWYFDPNRNAPLRVVTSRYRERARLAIQALERYRSQGQEVDVRELQKRGTPNETAMAPVEGQDTALHVGDNVIYRPPGDRRSYMCRIDGVKDDEILLASIEHAGNGWVKLSSLKSPLPDVAPEQDIKQRM